MMIKKHVMAIAGILSVCMVSWCQAAVSEPNITAKSAIVIEAQTGKVLYEKNAEEQRYPASTTKMMTLITALEYGHLDDKVTASTRAVETEGSSLWLEKGEQLTLKEMLYGIMLVSGNDATVAVAEHIAGSVEKFAQLMTEKAHAIGATHTHFTNSSGLPDPKHYSTAHDLARIAAYGYKNPLFTEIISTKNKHLPWMGKDFDRDIYNENRMLWLYDGANGVKTGYTDAAGRCLVSGALREHVQLITVVLDSERMWDDSIALLNYGFTQVKPVTLFSDGDIVKTVAVQYGKTTEVRAAVNRDFAVPLTPQEQNDLKTVVDVPDSLPAGIAVGQKLGVIHVLYKNQEIDTIDVVALDTAERKSFFTTMWSCVWTAFTFLVKNLA